MSKPKAQNSESVFDFYELFFSKTNFKGIIEQGNSVFSRVSAYNISEMLGKPHNLIRHPDMPGAVFKLLWDSLLAGQPIGTYVKNLSGDGKYYWVFATVFPVKNGYISIRIKPSATYFSVIRDLYVKLLQYEESHSLEESLSYLNTKIKDLGFVNYSTFMGDALVAELFSRDHKVKELASKNLNSTVNFKTKIQTTNKTKTSSQIFKVNAYFNEAQLLSDSLLLSLEAFLKQSGKQLESSGEVLKAFSQVKFISINMAISAEHYGFQAASLSTIAQGFENLSTDIYRQLQELEKGIIPLQDLIRQAKFNMGSVRIQIEMTHFFAEETMTNNLELTQEQEETFRLNFMDLSSLVLQYSKLVDKSFQDLDELIQTFSQGSKALEASLGGLRVIR